MDSTHFSSQLLKWYDQSKRILPWRNSRNPYYIWVSEIMLQQTRVETVIPYYERFITTLPTIFDLANVEDDVLHKLWEGLGYYSRARNLKKAAVILCEEYDCTLPMDKEILESLPGIGPYTSGAVSSIAFDQKYTAVDGNVLRVFARLLGIKDDIKTPTIKKHIKQQVELVLPDERIGDFNQGLMEIGATTCLPNGTPICHQCPLKTFCKAYENNEQDIIPVKQKKKKQKEIDKTILIFKHNDQYAIEKRPDQGLLAGLYQFPNMDGHLSKKDLHDLYPNSRIKPLPVSKHIFSHLIWNMQAFEIEVDEKSEDYIWCSYCQIESSYSIPTAFKRYKSYIKKHI